MNRTGKIGFALFLAAVLLGCALLVRDGLVAIAKEIRAKPWPRVPETLSISELTVKQATVQASPSGTNTNSNIKVTIENMKVDAQLPQPKQK